MPKNEAKQVRPITRCSNQPAYAMVDRFSKEPWYKAEPSGLGVLSQHVKVAIGLLEPEYLPGPNFRSAGYRLEECGPLSQENGMCCMITVEVLPLSYL